MANALSSLTLAQLRQALVLKERIDELQNELNQIQGTSSGAAPNGPPGRGRRKWSPAARARAAASQRARWAKQAAVPARGGRRKGRRRMSAAARARLSANARARWAKAKAAGRSRL